ncbi:MAG: hypothetical protein SWJ54_13820, partial [Cyanobacteriota bacterium]|nr:hypothetical protein [Cyanobacteriota bacterium]
KSTHKAVLEENYGVSIDELSEHQIVEHATTYGLANGLETSPVNVNGLIEKYKSELSEYFEISENKIAELDTNLVKTFALETAAKIDLDVKEFVNLEYYRGLGDELVENYRVEQVYSFNYEAAYNYTSEQSVRTSNLLNTEWFRQENAQLIEENKAELDKNQNGEVDEDELTGAMKGKFLDAGFETDKSYDLDEYIQEHGDMLTDFYDKSIEQVTNREVVEFAFGAGLKAGIDPYSQDFLLERSDLELDNFIAENAQELTQYYGVTEITQIDYYQAYQYQVAFGLTGSTSTSSSEGLV